MRQTNIHLIENMFTPQRPQVKNYLFFQSSDRFIKIVTIPIYWMLAFNYHIYQIKFSKKIGDNLDYEEIFIM